MEIKIKATGIELTEYLKKLINQKVKKIGKLFSEFPDLLIEVELEKSPRGRKKGDIFRSEIQIQVPQGKILRATSKKEDFRLALTETREEILLQISKYKERKLDKKRKIKF